ncbi:hypothetical protein LQ327_33330 [Actinomycetospora endophytica]|uniref:Uncharacterized protein n=1 Tax=Actinomycetospora endophytica TaxID=2291215 RepID=A0ABS8PJB7_9PSEU|nr:nuclear transport factor 2 family protein [Actinomycetospora endophytica]MCD2198259.1 hypothetical protein [Actinomycetospora endophytica]
MAWKYQPPSIAKSAASMAGDTPALAEVMSAAVVHRVPGTNPLSGDHKGRDAVFALDAQTMERPARTFRVDLQDVRDGTRAAGRWWPATEPPASGKDGPWI